MKTFVAEVYGDPEHQGGTAWQGDREANAKLIAAAPDLLAALELMVGLHAGQEHLYGLTNSGVELYRRADAQAQAAIAKAKGDSCPHC